MISEVVAGVLVDGIAATGRMLGRTLLAATDRGHHGSDLAIARWFDTYELTSEPPDLPELSGESAIRLGEILQSHDVQTVVHELLAARLTDAPEADVEQIRTAFSLTLRTFDPQLSRLVETVLFDYFDNEICDMTGRLEGVNPTALAQIRGDAFSARMIAILHAIERHTTSLSSRPQQQDESNFMARYRRHVLEYHGQIEPPDFERRRRVPIADLYVAPSIVEMADAQPLEQPREIDIYALADELDRTVLLGDPGGGKTTSANVLMHFQALEDQRRLPFMVTLREYAASDPLERSVVGHIEHRLEVFYQCPAPAGVLPRLLLTGAAIVIFDGLDELLDTAHRADVAAVVERFCMEYPLVPVLVTSRLVGYGQARLDDRQFRRYRIQGFSNDRVKDYVAKWFAQETDIRADQAAIWADEFMSESASVLDLRSSPLMLALMCILYRGEGSLPRNRAEVYEQCAGLLFRKWDARRRIHLSLRAGHLVEPAIRHLAWWLLTRGLEPAVTRQELLNEVAAFLSGRGFESQIDAREAASEFIDFCKGRMWVLSDTGTTGSGEALYSFTHRTFLEFFAAAHLAYSCDTPERLARTLAPRLAKHEWEVTSELAVQIKDNSSNQGAQRVYAALLGERRRRSRTGRSAILEFLARCLRSTDPSPRTVRELTRAILGHVFAGMPNDPVSYTPLTWLVASCTNFRDVVSDEIGKQISAMTGSVDPSVHLNGLRLAVWVRHGLWASASAATKPSVSPSLEQFWQTNVAELVQSYSDAIVGKAKIDTEIRYGALLWDLLTVDQALEMPGGLLPLMRTQKTSIFAITWASYLVNTCLTFCQLSHSAVNPDEAYMRTKVNDLSAVGRHLIRHPSLPWLNGTPQSWSDFTHWESRTEDYGNVPTCQLDSVAYLGAAAILLISTEANEAKILPTQGPKQLGTLEELYYYIAKRWDPESSIQLPRLPVPDSFRQAFYDWANGVVSFSKSARKGLIIQ